jgi:mono/diheme cytochrome c family protein
MTVLVRSVLPTLVAVAVLGGLCAGCACEDPPPRPPPPLLSEAPIDPALLEAAARYRVTWEPAAREAALRDGAEALVRNQCNRCHVIDEIEAASRPQHCVSCHVFLDGLTPDDRRYRTLAERYGDEVVQRYQRNIEHYVAVPDLTRVAARLRPEWIGEFVHEPWDLRPSMDETMVRTRLSEGDRGAIVRYFAAVAEVVDPSAPPPDAPRTPELERPDEARLARGAALFRARGCNLCHVVGNVDVGRTPEEIAAAGLPARLAPNLRFTRERMHPDVALQWILDPQSLHPTTTMPNLHLGAEDATLLRDYLWFVDPALEPTPAPSVHALPPALDRAVSWEEVKERVLGRICVHCHMNDHERDPGPGHVGGYGWPAAGLRMRTYEALVSGMPCDDPLAAPLGAPPVAAGSFTGPRCSVLEAREPGGVPPLLEVMLLRHDEEVRDRVAPLHDHARPGFASPRPGMPMGLPSIPDEEIALVRAWIEQGCVGPQAVTGMPGIPDGYLVPDGPIAVNRGCQVRAPAEERPAWASHPPPAFWRD